MALIETFWMACDSTERTRAEHGPFATRAEAEATALRFGFGYLLRYEHVMDEDDEIEEVRSVFIELGVNAAPAPAPLQWHTRCASCGLSAVHDRSWQAEVWADIHEFENIRHRVRLFERTSTRGLREIADWRQQSA
jgi:hypothetical protein